MVRSTVRLQDGVDEENKQKQSTDWSWNSCWLIGEWLATDDEEGEAKSIYGRGAFEELQVLKSLTLQVVSNLFLIMEILERLSSFSRE